MKLKNKILTLKYIIRKPMTRFEIMNRTHFSAGAVSQMTDELLEEGWILEGEFDDKKSTDTVRTRRQRLLKLNADKAYCAGLSIHDREISAGVINLSGHIIEKQTKTINNPDAQSILLSAKECLGALLKKTTVKVSGLGIISPGSINNYGLVLSCNRIPGYQNINLPAVFGEITDLPICAGNNASACALAEKWFGNAGFLANFITFIVGYGIGSGIFVNGRLVRGCNGFSSEFGHVIINPNGPLCSCGSYGCSEVICSCRAIENKIREISRQNVIPDLMSCENPGSVFESIVHSAVRGDKITINILDQMASDLGILIGMAVNIFNPGKIFLTDAIVANILISSLNPERHLITDGYPREVTQSESFEKMMKFYKILL